MGSGPATGRRGALGAQIGNVATVRAVGSAVEAEGEKPILATGSHVGYSGSFWRMGTCHTADLQPAGSTASRRSGILICLFIGKHRF
jgi:hypothetical protein